VWSLTTTSLMSSRPWHLIRHRHNLTFHFILSCPRLVSCPHYVRVFITELQCSQIPFVISCSEIGKTQKLRYGDRARHCILLQRRFKTDAVCMKTHFNISATKYLCEPLSLAVTVQPIGLSRLTSWLSALFTSHTCRFGSRPVPSAPISAATPRLPAIVSSTLCKCI
jgi:hypothetical protein